MAIELLAPAKLNLRLEVLGKRDDGYHEIASIMQTIDLADVVRLEASEGFSIEVAGERTQGVPVVGNLALQAAMALAQQAGRSDLGASIVLEKNVPAGVGLGGGSSDAAAVLRGLNRLWGLDLGDEALARVAATLGSDVPFFLKGGTALATGRGEVVEALPEMVRAAGIPLFIPEGLDLRDKTRRMYATLTERDFTDGRRTEIAAQSLRDGERFRGAIFNAFDPHVGEVLPGIGEAMVACREFTGLAVAAGSGPAWFVFGSVENLPEELVQRLAEEFGVRVVGVGFMTREQALAVREV